MKRKDFMKELDFLLTDISDAEREEALSFYNDYLDEAGIGSTDDPTDLLGSPERVAAMVRGSLEGADQNAGEYSERGYEDPRYKEDVNIPDLFASLVKSDQQKQADDQAGQKQTQKDGFGQNFWESDFNQSNNQDNNQSNNQSTGRGYPHDDWNERYGRPNRGNSKILLIILICVFAIPVGIPVVATVFSIFIGIICGLGGIFLGVGGAAIGLIAGGIATVVYGIFQMLGTPGTGIFISGGGLLMLAVGMLAMSLCVWMFGRILPRIVRGLVAVIRRPFKHRRRDA